MITAVVFLLILIGVNAFFASSEIALISLNDNKIKVMAEEGNKKAKLLVDLLGEPSRFLATIQIGITLAGFLASAFASETFATPLVELMIKYHFPVPEYLLKIITVTIITVLLAYFTLVLGELAPKRIAMNKSESIAFFVVTPLTLLSKITKPFVKFLTVSTNFCVRLFGIDPDSVEDDVTEEEIRLMVDVGEEKGAIDEREKVMINNIFDFGDKMASDVMTHRMEIMGIPSSASAEEIIDMLKKEKYSRIPVYEGNIDNIIGILNTKEVLLLASEEQSQDFQWMDLIRKPIFVPLYKKIDKLLVELQTLKTHMAVVVDEYGGTAGIITMEDLVEEIVGHIFDEHDEEEDAELIQMDEHTYEAKGTISLLDLEQALDMEFPDQEFETLNGFLVNLIGNIPRKGDTTEVQYKELRFRVLDATEKRIERVEITIIG